MIRIGELSPCGILTGSGFFAQPHIIRANNSVGTAHPTATINLKFVI
jgi:hypothetical protein